MMEHLVSFKFNRPLEAAEQEELLALLRGLRGQVPGIIELTCGFNETEETDNIHGFTLGLRVTFTDREALRDYGPHPAHQAFVSRLEGLVEQVVVVDYPFG
ncbi:Dabb family protein [Paenibacillus sp. FSL W8-1187]|uniref:Dabb family protein n=1 Tax=unclassified Paenibacillus TaxID=185978 RepID=UPI00129BBC2C|nr:Dabb family protein [Paenibacillus sp. B01]QGG54845.1 Dabb family protein [Paenibacillus sp. B01]